MCVNPHIVLYCICSQQLTFDARYCVIVRAQGGGGYRYIDLQKRGFSDYSVHLDNVQITTSTFEIQMI